MALSLRSVAAIALVLPLIAWKCGPDDGDAPPDGMDASAPDSGGNPTPGDDGAPSPTRDSGTTTDDGATDANVDAGQDVTDANSDDGGITDASEDGAGGSDGGAADAGTPYVVFVCSRSFGGSVTTRLIDSQGNRWWLGLSPVRAGDPVPAGAGSWKSAAPVVDLPNLLAAVAAMSTSTAGSTTTVCPVTTGFSRFSGIGTAGAAGAVQDLVARFANTENPPAHCERTLTNDPAWQELRKYNCAQDIDSSSQPW